MVRWYKRDWMSYDAVKDNTADVKACTTHLRRRQTAADERRAYGVLLSGGLDSSVISAIAKKFAARRIETDDKKEAWWPQLHSFAVGLKGAPDLAKPVKWQTI